MATVEQATPPLVAGDVLSRDEFLRRWEALPHLKYAELIGGIVYLLPTVTHEHGVTNGRVILLLGHYAMRTPGCDCGKCATWLMGEDVPQPYVHLAVLPAFGGSFRVNQMLCEGAPELAAEIYPSSASYKFHQKMKLYQAAGVQEYLTVLVNEQEVRWHRLEGGSYRRLAASSDGILRSVVFPGLWLNAAAFLAGDMQQVMATLKQGLDSPEHAAFVADLAARRR